jgi:hypothetical protein
MPNKRMKFAPFGRRLAKAKRLCSRHSVDVRRDKNSVQAVAGLRGRVMPGVRLQAKKRGDRKIGTLSLEKITSLNHKFVRYESGHTYGPLQFIEEWLVVACGNGHKWRIMNDGFLATAFKWCSLGLTCQSGTTEAEACSMPNNVFKERRAKRARPWRER